MPTIQCVTFETNGWEKVLDTAERLGWKNQFGDIVTLNFFNKPPDIPSVLTALCGFYRDRVSGAGGALLACDVITAEFVKSVCTLFKFQRVEKRGFDFLGSITIPFAHCSYVIKFQCPEQGTTGLREAMVFDQLLANRESWKGWNPTKGRNPEWFHDPYDPSISSPVSYFVGDDPKYDALFPDHPLSRVRRYLKSAEETIRLDSSLRTEEPFQLV